MRQKVPQPTNRRTQDRAGTARHPAATRRLPNCAIILAAIAVLPTGCQRTASLVLDPIHRSLAMHHLHRGERLLANDDPTGAITAFQRAVAHDPKIASAHAQLGRIHAHAGDLEKAVRHYRAAVKAAPDNASHALTLADALQHLATTSMDRAAILRAAVRAYRHALGLGPDSFKGTLGLARCYHELGAFDLAARALLAAGDLDPSAAIIHTELAAIHTARGYPRRALNAYKAALKIDPDDLRAHNGSGEINLALSRRSGSRPPFAREKALAHFRKSLQLSPEQPHIRALLHGLEPSGSAVAQIPSDSAD